MIDVKLVTVKVINAKLAKQVDKLCYDWKEGSEYLEIWRKLHGQDHRPLGWVNGETVGGPKGVRYWLLMHRARLVFWPAPDSGEVFDMHNAGLEQLFVG